MKITEPKTPFVRYNAELDIVENLEGPFSSKTALSFSGNYLIPLFLLIDIPKFNLDRRNSNPPTPSSPAFNHSASNAGKLDGQQTMSPEAQTAELPAAPGSEERRASFAAKQRSSSTGSRSSSRSTSFHLPDEDRVRLRRKNAEEGEVVDGEDDELDPEGESLSVSALYRGRLIRLEPKALFLLYLQPGCTPGPSGFLGTLRNELASQQSLDLYPFRNPCQRKLLTSLPFCPAQAKREAFLLARVRHYSNEAEAMKRAQELIAAEEEEAVESQGSMELDVDAEEESPRTERCKVPPVPPLPSNTNGVGK